MPGTRGYCLIQHYSLPSKRAQSTFSHSPLHLKYWDRRWRPVDILGEILYLQLLYPSRSFIESEHSQIVMDKILKSLVQNHIAYVYEDVCKERMWELNAEGTWPFYFSKLGRYWDSKEEIDIAAIDPEGKNLILSECKYWQEPVGVSVLRDLDAKAKTVAWERENRNTWYVLFSASGFTEELKAEVKGRVDLRLCEG